MIKSEVFQVQTAHATSFHNEVATLPIFPTFQNSGFHKFYLFHFSDKFDGLIGLDLIQQLNANLDFNSRMFKLPNTTIPIRYEDNNQNKCNNLFSYIIEPRSIQKIHIPVNISNGFGIFPYKKFGHIEIPECLVKIENNKILTTALNPRENPIKLQFLENLEIESIQINELNFIDEPFYQKIIDKETDDKLKANLKNINLNHCNQEEKEQIRKLCFEFRDIFHSEDIPLSFTNAIKHEIKLTDESPIHAKSYRYPEVHKEEVKSQISKLLSQNIIRNSNSPWSSPIWIVPKKMDNSGKQKWRMVIDYRKLNDKTINDKFPLPCINEILDKLGKAQYFTTLDLANGFYQIQMNESDIPKTAFSTDLGHYEYLRMPFGLKNAPATFQRVMNNILRGLQNETCFVYLDDVIIFSTSLQEHLLKLKKVFTRLREYKFKIQLDKSEFLRKEVQYLGHIVGKDGVKPNPEKIVAVKNFPIPKTTKEIKSFLGLVGYYRRFIKDFAKITKPMTQCLRKGVKIIHSPEFLNAFGHCKNLLINAPILQYPDFSKPFLLTTDASNYALGAVLSQGTLPTDKPIAYASRTLNESETRYSTIEKELLAVVWACKYFRPYLFGRKFFIYTDHRPLVWLFNLKEPGSKLVRWRLKLEEFDYQIIYKKGRQNCNADALSRIQLNIHENESIINNPGDSNKEIVDYLRNLAENPTQNDPVPIGDPIPSTSKIQITSDIQIASPSSSSATVHSHQPDMENNGLSILDEMINNKKFQYLFKKSVHPEIKIKTEQFEKNIIHYVDLPGNPEKIKNFIKEYIQPEKTNYVYFYSKELVPIFNDTYIKNFQNLKIIQCTKLLNNISDKDEKIMLITHQHQSKTNHRGIAETYEILKQRYYWPRMKNDINEYINNCLICQTAKYSRLKAYIPLTKTETPSKPFQMIHIDTFIFESQNFLTIFDKFSKFGQAYSYDKNAKSVCDKLINFFSFYGCPDTITCDNGGEFNNDLLKELLKAQKIDVHFTTPKHHESNSPVERFHSTIIEHLRILKQKDKNKSVSELMPYAIIAYNSTIHSTTKYSPHEIILGHTSSRDPLDLISTTFYSDYITSHKEKVDAVYENVVDNTNKEKERVLAKTNVKGNEPYDFKLKQKVYKKLFQRNKNKPKFSDAYEIIEILEHNRVRIKNVKKPDKIEVIHIKELKKPLVTDGPSSEEIPQNTTT